MLGDNAQIGERRSIPRQFALHRGLEACVRLAVQRLGCQNRDSLLLERQNRQRRLIDHIALALEQLEPIEWWRWFQEFDRRGTVNDAIRRGQTVFQKLAELPCPTVAAIHGFCMGGGTEISLACRYRVASSDPSTRIGLPEVKLGIFPGWGGSARLPKLIGAPAAMDLMLTGRTVSASAAKAMGLVDKVTEPAVLIDTAVSLAQTGQLSGSGDRFVDAHRGMAGGDRHAELREQFLGLIFVDVHGAAKAQARGRIHPAGGRAGAK